MGKVAEEMNEAMVQLQYRFTKIADRSPRCLNVTVRVDEDERMVRNM